MRRTSVLLGVCAAVVLTACVQGASRETEQYAAMSLVRIGLMDLRLREDPHRTDYLIADALFAQAERLTPDDDELVRRRIEAAYMAGDSDLLRRSTRRLVELDPRDTVALLRLITMRINQLQTADDRIEAYERFLGPRGVSIDASVRSRLALDAALLLREQGDVDGFAEKLEMATSLDPTNKEAAATAVAFYGEQVADDPEGRLELTMNLLIADPLDPHVHLSLSRQLARLGDFRGSARFHANGRRLHQLERGTLDEALRVEQLNLQWHVGGPGVPLESLERSLQTQRYEARVQRGRLREQGLPVDTVPPPEEIHLPAAFGGARVLAAHAAGDDEALERAMTDLRAFREVQTRMLRDPEERPVGIDRRQAERFILSLMVEEWTLRAWTGKGVDEIFSGLRQTGLLTDGPEELAEAVRGWVMLASGDDEAAVRTFSRRANQGDVRALVGLGLAAERLDHEEQAIQSYAFAWRNDPLGIVGAWARTRMLELTGEDGADGDRRAASSFARQVPRWIDQMTQDPANFMSLDVRLNENTQEATKRAGLQIDLRNTAPIPLAIGPNRPLNSRFLVTPSVDVGLERLLEMIQPEVIDLDRRLRLESRDRLRVTVWPDPGFSGWFAETLMHRPVRVRYRVLQGFRRAQDDTMRAGPLTLSGETGILQRRALPMRWDSPDELAERLSSAEEHDLPVALAAARAFLLLHEQEDIEVEALEPIVDALAERYPSMSEAGRIMVAAAIPHARLAPPAARLDSVIREERSEAVLPVVLATRVTEASDELLELAGESDDRDLRTLAARLADRLEDERPSFATAGPGVESLVGAGVPRGGGNRRRR